MSGWEPDPGHKESGWKIVAVALAIVLALVVFGSPLDIPDGFTSQDFSFHR